MPNAESPPLVLIVDDEPLNRAFVQAALTAAGWHVESATSGAAALAALRGRPLPALVLMDLNLGDMTGVGTAAEIRADPDARAAAVPILAFTTTRILDSDALVAQGFDGMVAKPCSAQQLVAAVAPWHPDGVTATLDRLEASFGTAEIGPMAERFAVLLTEALAALDHGDARPLAHRIAGIAGTLGFAEVGRTWLAISEGDESLRDDAHRQTRRALAALARRSQ